MEQAEILFNNLNNVCSLRNMQLSDLHIVGYGESSIVFDLDNEIIKLTFNEYDNHPSMKEYVSHSSAILQPNFEIIIDKVKQYKYCAKIIGLKKLSLEGITNEDVLNVYTKLENIGKDENGNIFLIDYDELIYINDLDLYHKNK